MRIFGGHDYYDSALAYGQDDDVVFLREHKEVPVKGCPLYAGYPHAIVKSRSYWQKTAITIKDPARGIIELDILPMNVYVAGRHYGGMRVVENFSRAKVENFWQFNEFQTWLAGIGHTIAGPRKRDRWVTVTPEMDAFPTLESFFTPQAATPAQLEWLVNNRIVIAVWCDPQGPHHYRRSEPWRCNSTEKGWSLKDLDFPRAVDPYTLFQELSMFVGGVLPRNPNPMVEITDQVVKAEKHGFDKWSFRKHKEDI